MMDPLLLEDPADLRYRTGLSLSRGIWIEKESPILVVDGRYYEMAKSRVSCEVVLDSKDALSRILEGSRRICFDSSISVARFQELQKLLPNREWIAIDRPLKQIRAIKTAKEIESLKKAAALTFAGFQYLTTRLREGIRERDLAWEFEQYVRTHGASGLSFESIVAFGENSAYPHHRAGDRTLRSGDIVLLDLGAIVEDYHGDMTRVVFFGEPKNAELVRFLDVTQKVATSVIQAVRPGVTMGALDRMARDQYGPLKELFIHSLGHGVGLETHEFPRLKWDGEDRDVVAEEGMVFTVEPGLYRAGLGGVRHEEMVLVTKEGAKLLHE